MEREFFQSVFERAAAAMKQGGKLHFARPTPLPEARPISLLPNPRVVIPLSGVMPFEYSDGEKIHFGANLLPGSGIYAGPYGWSNPGWNCVQEFVSLVFHNEYLRFIHLSHDGSPASPGGPDIGKEVYHTSLRPSRTVSLLVGVMNSYSESPADEREGALKVLLVLIEESLSLLRRDQPCRTGKAHRVYQNIRDFMRDNYSRPLTRELVAERFSLNPCYVSRLFMDNGGSFNAYLMSLRMDQALHLLENSDISIKEIAYHTGFNSTGYFIRCFSARYGVTPGAFREEAGRGGKEHDAGDFDGGI